MKIFAHEFIKKHKRNMKCQKVFKSNFNRMCLNEFELPHLVTNKLRHPNRKRRFAVVYDVGVMKSEGEESRNPV